MHGSIVERREATDEVLHCGVGCTEKSGERRVSLQECVLRLWETLWSVLGSKTEILYFSKQYDSMTYHSCLRVLVIAPKKKQKKKACASHFEIVVKLHTYSHGVQRTAWWNQCVKNTH